MPFPFSKLQYGNRRRLRELSNPEEAYDIQLAVGNDITGLQPIVMLQSVKTIQISGDDADTILIQHCTQDFYVTHSIADISLNTLLDVKFRTILEDVTENFLKNAVLDKLYIKKCEELLIFSNMATLQLVQKLSQRMSPTTFLLHTWNPSAILLPDVFALFPDIKCVNYPKLYIGWVRDLLSVDRTGITFQSGDLNSPFKDVFNFESKDLAQLLKKNWSIFVSCTYCDISVEAVESKAVTIMGTKFKVKSDSNLPRFSVLFKNSSSYSFDATKLVFVLQ